MPRLWGHVEKHANDKNGTAKVVVSTCRADQTWQLAIGCKVTLVIVPLQRVKVATTKETAAFTYKAALLALACSLIPTMQPDVSHTVQATFL